MKSLVSKKIKNDLLLVGIILFAALGIFLVFKLTMKDGNRVTVSVNGKKKYSFSIREDTEQVIAAGEYKNTLVIKNGKAYVSQANCPDKICVGHRAVSKAGETIVCLPHKLVVEVTED